ncbi:MAG TPA: peptide chain release factor N(5)-glutamine methyltransferase [Defluviicoccus sp.]|nr:peptide chain release factor N(5)-glutamine methyltransferase [Defluviicoccus sp.]
MSMAATIGQALAAARLRLREVGIPDAGLDARVLVGQALGLSASDLIGHPERALTDAGRQRIEALLDRRLRREPVAYITGGREFWSLPLSVTPAALIPRPDSETLIEAVLDDVGDRSAPLRIVDLGTGSGCLVLALLHELANATAVAVDRSGAALHLARMNALALGLANRLRFVASDWTSALAGPFDIVVTNPPYVATAEWPGLAPEIRLFEPQAALLGGDDGLSAYRRIVPDLPRILAPQGRAYLECGHDQGDRIAELLRGHGFAAITVQADLGGRARCISASLTRLQKKVLGMKASPDYCRNHGDDAIS